jgi:hypothetical protein
MPSGMWLFLIPVIILAGATFAGSAVQMASAPAPSSSQAAPARTSPFNSPLPFDPPYRQR